MSLITFDFHNTLAHCDTWFELEVFTLASEVARDLRFDIAPEPLNATYRTLRQRVLETGTELSAVEGATLTLAEHDLRPTEDAIVASVSRLMRAAASDLHAVPGAVETVRYLHAEGYSLGVVSSAAHHEFLEWALAEFGILDFFGFILTSASVGIYKSRPALYEHAMSIARADPATSLHIGDSMKWDVETASIAGMHTAWLVSIQRHPSSARPDLTFTSLVGAGPTIHSYMCGLP